MADDEVWESGKQAKKWFRVNKTSAIHKVAASYGQEGASQYRVSGMASASIPKPPQRKVWEVELYKLLGTDKYKVLVEYDHMKYCELRIINKGKDWNCVDCKVDVEYPNEFAGSGGGFDGAGLGGFGGTKDGIMKSLSAFSSSNAVKLGKVKYKPKKKTKAPKKLASGHNLFTALGTQEIETREFDGGTDDAMVEKDQNYITAAISDRLGKAFALIVQISGEIDDGLDGKTAVPRIPFDKILDVFDQAKYSLSEVQRKRIVEMARLDKNEFIEIHELLDILNRTMNEQRKGHFHMTVRELQEQFQKHDADHSGQLNAYEVSSIMGRIHLVTDEDEVKKMMSDMDKDSDGVVDFEEFMSLCQQMYRDRGGKVVANKSGPCSFNQTRTIIDDLKSRVERHHLMISHLKAQIGNLEEQLEVMNTIEQHSALQQELNKTNEEKKRLTKLRDEMEMQHKGWMRDIKGVHGREKRDVMEKIQFIQQQEKEASEYLNYVVHEYETDFKDAVVEVGEIMQSLKAVYEFCEKTIANVNEDANIGEEMARVAAFRLKSYEEGRKGTVFNPAVYDSAQAIANFLQSKTSALEKWLISRTKFTQSDREKYLKRVEEVKKQREEYEINKVELTKALGAVEKLIGKEEKSMLKEKGENESLRAKLMDPTKRVHDESKMKELSEELEALNGSISQGHKDKLEWSLKLYPVDHDLHMERHKIELLQVELGEMKIILENIHHHKDVETRTEQLEIKAAKKAGTEYRGEIKSSDWKPNK